ncbi:uncharacterized protein AKAW2_41234S [Aspergillus luchuensis]|uniref:Similar to An08g09580 n=1 Tax=Aspergillus kawachii TaxID=1069201 RepID=A0A146EYX6_ASPKA|nr:uncharacterized protein AKAW2_41234S [Aspergillus luchuensis]BCR99551.1 hypothetical protein AKAW2_41234S [Aspergillus luchuensis]BCS11847.1 hypothetical protein ALUC_41187S [Aspergillus luchuensis]GAA91442.1 similar to An08g09580 [Aspergillus luchuensis IFO 4308]GAT19190.1 similar to An08g09580 [Aspergillus luchuensis]
MGSTSVSWEVTSLEVQVTTPNATSDALFANGNMQVPVIVVIKAIDPDTNTVYELSDLELETIKLIDYDDPPTELPESWSYSSTENEFEHTLPASTKGPRSEPAPFDVGIQKKRYWVTTTELENKRIAASIKQPNGTVVHTGGGTFDSKVTLTGTQPKKYERKDLHILREDTADGGFSGLSGTWDQDNYYLFSKIEGCELRKADFYDYMLGDPDPALEYAVAGFCKSIPCSIFYYWPMGPEEKRTAGRSPYTAEITINQRSDALCFTRMWLKPSDKPWNDAGYRSGKFTVYDKYGNSGVFYTGYEDDNNKLYVTNEPYKG